MKTRPWLALLGFCLLVATVATAASAITASSVRTWYVGVAKPEWTPPGWVFGPTWTFLYAMMSLVAWRLWLTRKESPADRLTLQLWLVQLGLNGAWSFLFFGLRSPAAGLIDIVVLLATVIWIQIRLHRSHRVLAWCWLLYGAWLSFATALNLAIWLLAIKSA